MGNYMNPKKCQGLGMLLSGGALASMPKALGMSISKVNCAKVGNFFFLCLEEIA
jgi:hypothetical protein